MDDLVEIFGLPAEEIEELLLEEGMLWLLD